MYLFCTAKSYNSYSFGVNLGRTLGVLMCVMMGVVTFSLFYLDPNPLFFHWFDTKIVMMILGYISNLCISRYMIIVFR